MEYEIIDVDNTSIIRAENGETLFLNETATKIIKEFTKGLSKNEIYKSITNEYEISKEDDELIEWQINKVINEFIEIVGE